ncbi:MAG: amino acid adenylation domain-containing protein [Rhodothermaceae bacterium]|nr:amino acid adenylation domain-containing protein [Rhodothermaceae bacterium]
MRTLHGLLRDSARQFPDRTAVRDPERDVQVSYRDLDAITDRLQHTLERIGVAQGDRVGLCAPKSIGTVAALFGAMKAGGAYVPVDYSAPASRNAFIFRNCAVKALVVDRTLVDGLVAEFGLGAPVAEELTDLRTFGVDLVLLRGPNWAEADEPPAEVDAPEGLSYILYTSGSTGVPKGVMHNHSTALAFVDWCSEVFEPTEEDRFSSHAPFHFDLSILDLYVPIKHGGTLVLVGEDVGKQPLRLAPLIADEGITAWYSTPSILRLLVEYGKLEQHDYSALRIVNFAGEVFPIKYLRATMEAWPHPRYFNLYGPTETNVCTYYEVPDVIAPERTEPLPIGQACSDDRCLVMDTDDTEVPTGEPGELYVAGGSVMLGYWNLPDRNATAFWMDADGTPWYKTGDIVQEDEAGDYLFRGRRDRMVKRRGYRVELGEIEAALYRHDDIAEAAVIAKSNGGDVHIKAFVAWAGEGKASLIAMKRYCSEALPLYMIPDSFAFEDALPKTSTDKVDYQRLKALA